MDFIIHKPAESELHHRLTGVGVELIVHCDPAEALQPRERSLHDPSERQDVELLGRLVRPEHHGEVCAQSLADVVNEPLSLVSAVGEYLFQVREASAHGVDDGMRAHAVMDVGLPMDVVVHRKAKRVNHNVFLATLDLLVVIEAAVGGDVVG